MNDRQMLLVSILYQLVRGLLGLIVVVVRRDLSKDAELLVLQHENTVLRRQGALYARRPGVAGHLVPVCPAPPLGGGFLGGSCHDPGLASQIGFPQGGLHRTPPVWTSPDCDGGQEAGASQGEGETHRGAPTGAG